MDTMVGFSANKICKFFILSIFLGGCVPDFKPKDVVLISIQTPVIKFEWHSKVGLLDQKFPDYILVVKNNKIDTLCYSTNITDLVFSNSNLIVQFSGAPRLYDKRIKLNSKIYNNKIIIDSNGVDNDTEIDTE